MPTIIKMKTASVVENKEDMEKRTLVHYWWAGEAEQLLWETVWRFLKQLKTELPDDPAMVLLSIYPKEFKARSQRDFGMLMFAAALLTIIAKRWGQLKCPSTHEQKEKIQHIHTVEHQSSFYKEENPGKDEPQEP